MLRGIAWVLGVLLVLGGCWWLYNHATEREVPTNGEVFVRPSPADANDQQTLQDTQAKSDIDGNPVTQQPAAAPTQPAPAQPATAPQQAAVAPAKPAPAITAPAPQSTPAASPTTPLPVADTVAPNPPNGMVFAGSGKYQWYRQGNLTWRVNTQTGTSCIAFATDEEWRKSRVYSHGCRNA